MPSTYHQLLYHLVFSTKNRQRLIPRSLAPQLYAYIGGILRTLGGVALAAGGMENHIHLLIGLKPVHAIAAVLRELKSGSSEWIRLQKRQADFFWQEGYAAFTVSPTARESVSRYIGSQEEHHRMRTFREELVELLNENGIEFDERYLD